MNKNNNKTLLLLYFAIFSQIDSEKKTNISLFFWERVQLRQTAKSLLQEIL
jgi:hypothetical protein